MKRTALETMEHGKIIQQVADNYTDWRRMYGAPRSDSATLNMIEDILEPLLDRLSSWSVYEKSAAATLDDIKNLIANNEPTQGEG